MAWFYKIEGSTYETEFRVSIEALLVRRDEGNGLPYFFTKQNNLIRGSVSLYILTIPMNEKGNRKVAFF